MSLSYVVTQSTTFTLTDAKHMSAKVATDLKRIQRLYGLPSDERIASFEAELIAILKGGYLESVSYGFKIGNELIEPSLRYDAKDLLGASTTDDDPGKIRSGQNVDGATFYSYLTFNSAWHTLSTDERAKFEKTLPFIRSGAPEPTVKGYFTKDLTYSSGGRSLNRSSVRSY